MPQKIPARLMLECIEPSRRGLSFCAVNEDAFADWLNNLPITNTLKCYQLLIKANHELIELRIPQILKLALLNMLSQKNNVIGKQLQKQYLNKPTVLTKQDSLTCHYFEVLIAIQASAFRQVLAESQKKFSSLFGARIKTVITQAAGNLLYTQEKRLLNQLLRYQQPESGFWCSIHQIFQYCESLEIIDVEITSPITTQELTISLAYKRLVLLALFKTEQLPQTDINKVKIFVDDWAQRGQLSPLQPTTDSTIKIDTYQDQPFLNQHTSHGPGTHQFDITPIIDAIENTSTKVIKLSLRTHLINCLRQNQARQFKRLNVNKPKPYEIAVGFSAAHYFLRDQQPLANLIPNATTNSLSGHHFKQKSEFSFQQEEASNIDIWDLTHHLDIPAPNKTTLPTIVSKEKSYPLLQAKMINISAGGFCFEVNHTGEHTIRSGDIILIRECASQTWQLANIRWIKSYETRLSMGVALLSPKPVPIVALNSHRQQQSVQLCRAILIHKNPFAKKSLLLPQIKVSSGQKIQFYQQKQLREVYLREQLLASGLFLQFNYQEIQSVEKT